MTVTNALTIDFEDWYQGLEIPHTSWDGYEDRIEASGRRVLAELERAGVHATFFVLGRVAERHPHLVREIAAAGHEIATHGWSHTLVYQLTPDAFRAELLQSIRLLEELGGQPILGHRAPFFSITRASLWALDILAEAGIRYDSSVFPVLNYRYGIEDAPRWPYGVETARGPLTEFPITTWRCLGRNLPVAGGAYFRIYPYALTWTAFKSINGAGKPAVFYLHPWELDPGQPRPAMAWRYRFRLYVGLEREIEKLSALLGRFRFGPAREVLPVVGPPARRLPVAPIAAGAAGSL
jgi:polysaccharide deacetylase family protein (PEP-CTERM system associated)